MKKIFELGQNLQNLNRIKRAGGNLALGLPTDINISVAEHSYTVAYLAMFFVDKLGDKEVNFERVIRQALIHDWREMIMGDIPAGSPSFASFWGINIKEEAKKTGEKATIEILKFIEEEIDTDLYKTGLNDKEKLVLKAADLTAYLLEMQEWKYLGFKHDGWEMIWFNTVALLEKVDLAFIPELVREIKENYQRDSKRPSPFLAKASEQINPEHKL